MAKKTSYGGILRRYFALLIDSAILTITFIIMFFVAKIAFNQAMQDITLWSALNYLLNETVVHELNILYVTHIFVAFAYFTLMESSKMQGTIGKKILWMKVTDSKGSRISLLRATGRNIVKFISFAIPLLILVDIFTVWLTKTKQTIHDFIAGCDVENE